MTGYTHPLKACINLVLVDAVAMEIESANVPQGGIDFVNGLVSITSVEKRAEVNMRDSRLHLSGSVDL